MTASLKKGWCPGALRPMESGDGLLVRLRVSNGVLSTEAAIALAQAASRFGNGVLELTARGNLQFRGVRAECLDELLSLFGQLKLLDQSIESEAVRNVTPSPLAGFDATATLDAGPLVRALELRLAEESSLHSLPAKFGFLVDGGGCLPLTDIGSDIRFEAFCGASGPGLVVRLGSIAVSTIEPSQIADVGSRLAHAFLDLRESETRMASLVRRIGAKTIAQRAGIAIGPSAVSEAALASPRRVEPSDYLGVRRLGAGAFVGAAFAFGSMRATDLSRLAAAARARGVQELRLTAWRAILAPGLDVQAASRLSAELAGGDLILDASDSRLSISACVGMPACGASHADVRAAAHRIACLGRSIKGRIHLAGCAKGCGQTSATGIVAVATPRGYDLIEDGRARDEPVMRNLDVEALVREVGRRSMGILQ